MPRRVRDTRDELGELLHRSTAMLATAMDRLAVALWRGNLEEQIALEKHIASIVQGSMTLGDLMGRRRLILEMAAAKKMAELTAAAFAELPPSGQSIGLGVTLTPDLVPPVPFQEAIEDIASRVPEFKARTPTGLAAGTDLPMYKWVQQVYSRHGFAAAHSTSLEMTEKLQAATAQAIREGTPLKEASEVLQRIGGFNRAYADTIHRTSTTTAHAAGRFAQAEDPDLAGFIAGMQYVALGGKSGDGDTRDNHRALHGFRAPVNDGIWDQLSPPNGYQCRCSLIPIDRISAKRNGWLDQHGNLWPGQGRTKTARPASGGPDAGFAKRGRPDRRIYGG